jgi:hypothetical protein
MKLSDFKGDKGVEVIGKLLIPVTTMASNPHVRKAAEKGLPSMVSAMLTKTPKEARELLAILNDKSVEEYECNGATVLVDVLNLFTDEALLGLFGLQS